MPAVHQCRSVLFDVTLSNMAGRSPFPTLQLACVQIDPASTPLVSSLRGHDDAIGKANAVAPAAGAEVKASTRGKAATASSTAGVVSGGGTAKSAAAASSAPTEVGTSGNVAGTVSSPLPALDALINTEIHTPRADGGGALAGGGGNGGNGGNGGKKKSFFTKRFFVGAEKGGGARGNAGLGVAAADNGSEFSALSAANAKGRDPSEVNGRNLTSSSAGRNAPGSATNAESNVHGSDNDAGVGTAGAGTSLSLPRKGQGRPGRSTLTSGGSRANRRTAAAAAAAGDSAGRENSSGGPGGGRTGLGVSKGSRASVFSSRGISGGGGVQDRPR